MCTLDEWNEWMDAADAVLQAARRSRRGWAAGPGRIVRKDGLVEATRFYRADGAEFSGWIVSRVDGPSNVGCSDPISTKAAAIAALLAW
jgi:hypothetical protein